MGEVVFGAGQTPVAPAPQAKPAEVVSNPTQAVVQQRSMPVSAGPSGMLLGDKIPDFSEIILPRVNLAQNIGKLKDTFVPGTLVLNLTAAQVVLFCPPDIDAATGNVRRKATPPAEITVLGFRPTRYVEKVPGGGRGALVNTEAEVRAQGGTLDYKEWNMKKAEGMKRFEYLADALVLIKRPEAVANDDTVFVYKITDGPDKGEYALALWGMKGTVYTAAAKRVFFTNRSIGCLRKGYPTFHFNVSTRLEKWPGGNESWIPVCVQATPSSPQFIDFVAQIIGDPDAAAASAQAVDTDHE